MVTAVPLALVGYALIDVNQRVVEQLHEELLFSVVDDVAERLDSTLSEAKSNLDAVAKSLGDADKEQSQRIAVARSIVAASEALVDVAIYDHQGGFVDAIRGADSTASSLPKTVDLALRKTASTGVFAFSEVTLRDGVPHVLALVPIPGRAQTWFAASYISLAPLQARVAEISDARFGRDGEVFVVDRRLRAIAHSDLERVVSMRPLTDEGILDRIQGGAINKGIAVFGRFSSSSGPMVGALRSLPRFDWAVVAQLPRDVAYSSLVRMRNIVLVTVLAAILVAMLIAILVARKITAPIKDLVGLAAQLSERNFEARANVRSRDELRILGNAMNSAAANLASSEEQIKREVEIRKDLRRYLPGELVDQVVRRERDMALGGERRAITVMFADVAGFTPLAEQRAAEEVVTILNQLFTILTEIVFRHGGTVDKFLGDSIMAFWGAPSEQPDHAALALAAAEDMQSWLETANESWEQRYGVRIRLAVGVNTGEAIVGNFGSEARMEYTAIGDVVNVAARLEAIARPGQILTTGATMRAAGASFDFLPVGETHLAGREKSEELYEVAG